MEGAKFQCTGFKGAKQRLTNIVYNCSEGIPYIMTTPSYRHMLPSFNMQMIVQKIVSDSSDILLHV